VPVGEVIASVVRPKGEGRHDKLSRLEAVWNDAVGKRIAKDTRLVQLKNRVLLVEARSSGLAQELSVYMKARLLKLLREGSGLALEDLRCRVGGWNEG